MSSSRFHGSAHAVASRRLVYAISLSLSTVKSAGEVMNETSGPAWAYAQQYTGLITYANDLSGALAEGWTTGEWRSTVGSHARDVFDLNGYIVKCYNFFVYRSAVAIQWRNVYVAITFKIEKL